MIDSKTLRFISCLNELSEKLKAGVVDFKDVNEDNRDKYEDYLIYDGNSKIVDDYEDGKEAITFFDIVGDMVVDKYHHDIVSYYADAYNLECKMSLIHYNYSYSEEEYTIYVEIPLCDNVEVTKNGWRCL